VQTILPLALAAYGKLIRLEFYLARGNFAAIHNQVRNYPVRNRAPAADTIDRVCLATDMACIWYCKQVLCLQRSAATVWLLRRHGIAAHMVIGAQQLPFKAHAWVEVDGRVVNDKPYMPEIYGVLDRC
jgi:hypothetical protein